MRARIESFPDRAQWLKARRSGIGASESPNLFGVGYASPIELYASKVNEDAEEIADEPAVVVVERDGWSCKVDPRLEGTHTEGSIAALFSALDSRRVIDPRSLGAPGSAVVQFRHADIEHMTAAPDRLLDLGGTIGDLEIKLSRHSADDWKNGIPLDYQIQFQHQLAVLGIETGALVVWHVYRAELRCYEISADPAFQRVLIDKCGEFWQRVQQRRQPDIDMSGNAVRALKSLYRTPTEGTSIEVDPRVAARFYAAQQIRKLAEEREAFAKAELMSAQRDAEYVTINGERVARWRMEKQAQMVSTGTHLVRKGPILQPKAAETLARIAESYRIPLTLDRLSDTLGKEITQ